MPCMTRVPAAEQTLAILSLLARSPGPLPAARIAGDLGLPRSTVYHLLAVLTERGYVVHLPEERRYGLGMTAYELGNAYTRQAPLARLARPVLAKLVDAVGESGHLAVLNGREVVYLVEERAPGRDWLVTDVGVRLPATLTASGRAVLAGLPAAQVRALFPDASAFTRRGDHGPATPTDLRRLLAETRSRGHASELDEVTPGFASIAVAVHDHNAVPVAGIALTWRTERALSPTVALPALERAAEQISQRISGRRAGSVSNSGPN